MSHALARGSIALWAMGASIVLAAPPCDEIDFDDRPANEIISPNQPYLASKGVQFGVFCPGATGPADMTISSSPSGTIPNPPSGPNCLASPFGDFLGDCCIIIDFAQPQRFVRLQVAAEVFPSNTPGNALTVQACDALGNMLITKTVALTQLSGSIVPNPKLMWDTAAFDAGNCIIKQIKVCTVPGVALTRFYIDDVGWGGDTTEPAVAIDQPAEKACVCNGNLTVTGTMCDTDSCGTLTGELRIRPIVSGATNTAGSPPWSTLGTFTGNICSTSSLFSGVLNSAQYPEGEYLLKLEATNACGLDESDERVIYIDRNPPTATINCPTPGQIIRGLVPVLGVVNDPCIDNWDLYWANASGVLTLIGTSQNNAGGTLGSIDTRLWPDGNYHFELLAVDECLHFTTANPSVIVDNTPPIATIVDPVPCEYECPSATKQVRGIIADTHLAGWRLEYKLGTQSAWTTIATGTNPVGNPGTGTPGVIATWDQCGLPRCCYILRLTAWDAAGGCPAPGIPNSTEFEMCASLGLEADINGDGVLNSSDFLAFLNIYATACPPCP